MLIVCEGLTWILLDNYHCYDASHTVRILPNILSPNHRQLWPPWYREYYHHRNPRVSLYYTDGVPILSLSVSLPPLPSRSDGYDLLTNSNVSWLCYVCANIHPWWKMTRVLRKRCATVAKHYHLLYRSRFSWCRDRSAEIPAVMRLEYYYSVGCNVCLSIVFARWKHV